MHNQSITPESYHPLVDAVPGEQAIHAELEKTRSDIRRAVAQLPPHEEFIARNCKATGVTAPQG